MNVAEVERRSGLSRDTLRFYERRGVLTPPRRQRNGYRQYDGQTLAELRFIAAAREVGFTLSQIREAIPKLGAPPARCGELLRALGERRRQVLAQVALGRRQLRRLDRLIQRFGDAPER